MEIPKLKVFAYLAFIMPAFFTIMWILSATIDGSWTFGINSLSDMGISENPTSAFLFNFGCMVTGILGVLIGFGMFAYGKRTNKAGGLLYIVSMVFLALVGVFTLPQTMHYVVATSYGLFFGISVVVSSVSDWKLSWYPYFDLVYIVFSVIVVSTQVFEMWEPIMVIAAMVWTVIIGYKMIREESLFNEEPDLGLV